jgi:hypothetical protein
MYQPNNRFAKAYQEELLREARNGDSRPASKPAGGFFLFRLLARLFSRPDNPSARPTATRDGRNSVSPNRVARTRY